MPLTADIQLSVIVVVYNMRREAPRTLYSLSPAYQREIKARNYEVIVVENGSTEPLSEGIVADFGPNFRYFFHDTFSPSPVGAINFGVRMARSEHLMISIDGARILSPSALSTTLRVVAAFAPRPTFVAMLAWHLGPDIQVISMRNGYNKEVEDQLLTDIDWKHNGYDLFNISAFAPSSGDGWLVTPAESSFFAMPRTEYDRLGGFDERFQQPGGGLAPLDFFKRALAVDELVYVILLGEGSFHQIHGGESTNACRSPWEDFHNEYISIRGHDYTRPNRAPVYFGTVPEQCLPFLRLSVDRALGRSSETGSEIAARDGSLDE